MYGENKSKLFWSVSQDNEDAFLVGVINDTLDSVIRGSEYLEKVLEIIENTDGVGDVIRSTYGKSKDFCIEFNYTVDTSISVSGNLFGCITVSMFSVFGQYDCGCSIYNEERPIVVDNVDARKRNMSNLIAVPDTLDAWTAMTEYPDSVIALPYTKHTPVMKAIIAQLQDWDKNYRIDTIEFCPGGKEETNEK